MGVFASFEGVFAQDGHPMRNAAIAIAAILTVNFLWTFYKTRKFYRDLPGPPHSWFFGHLPALVRASSRFPPDVHPQLILNSLVQEYSLHEPGVMYLDTFPIRMDNQMVITRGNIASQISVHHAMRKHPALNSIFGLVIGTKAISIMEGEQWKDFRGTFAPGFAPGNITMLMPDMVDEGEVFVSKLETIAALGGEKGGYTPSILHLMKDLSADIIVRLTVGTSSHCQETPNELIELIAASSRWPQPASINPLQRLDLVTPLALRYYDWRTRRIIRRIVEDRWEKIWTGEAKEPGKWEPKTILDMALFKYLENRLKGWTPSEKMDPEFLAIMCDNVKGFVFGGQDTTANSTAWVLYCLSKHPEVLEKVRREHDDVFGTDPDAVGKVLRKNPNLISGLPWTTAVIKESMRTFAPASSIRESDDDMVLQDPQTGRILPTKNQLIFMPTHVYSRDESNFHHSSEFRPSRFIPYNSDSQKVDSDVYRPFEKGPRACIGQDFAMSEMKLILCLVSRKFAFEDAYEELNRRRGTKVVRVEGEGGAAYPVLNTTAQPKDGMPMWIKIESTQQR